MSRSESNPASVPKTTLAAGCCGGPAPEGTDACCSRDADAKVAGASGCGCNTPTAAPATRVPAKSGCC